MERFFSKPRLIIGVVMGITVFFAAQLLRVGIDNNNFRFIPKKDPARVTAEWIDDKFGSQVTILVAFERKYGSVFERDFIERLRAWDERVSAMPLVETVVSLVSTDYITGSGGAIIVEPLVTGDFSGSETEISGIRARVRSWDMYDRMLVSDDSCATQAIIALDVGGDEAGTPETLAAFREIRAATRELFASSGTDFYVTGLPVFSATINEAVLQDLAVLVPLVVIVVLLTLFFSFRRAFAVIVPILTVLIATIWSVGAMPLFGIKMSILTTILPVILVAVGSAYGIHVVSHYIDEREREGLLDEEGHRRLVFALVRRIGKPVSLAALTTFAGFISFCFTSVVPIREFGYFASFGVLVAFAVAMTFIPALFLARGPVPLKPRGLLFKPVDTVPSEASAPVVLAPGDPLSDAITTSFLGIVRGKRKVLVFTALLCIASAFLIPKIIVDNVLVEYFHADSDMARSDEFIRRQFGGSKTVSIVVESDEPGGVLDPAVLLAMDGLSEYLETRVKEVGKVTSFTDLLKRINQVYNGGSDSTGGSAPESAAGSGGSAVFAPDPAIGSDSEIPFGFGGGVADPYPDADGEPAFGFASEETPSFGFASAADVSAEISAPDPAPAETSAAGIRYATLQDLAGAVDAAVGDLASPSPELARLSASLKKEVNYDGLGYYEIPADPAKYGQADTAGLKRVIGNYMMLLSGDIGAFADDPLEPKAVRMNVQMRTTGQIDTDRVLASIRGYIADRFPESVRVTVGGFALVEGALNNLVVQSQLVSIAISLVIVFLILAVAYRSAAAGIIGIIPLSLSILLNFAVMAFLGIKLNVGTALVASVAIGTGIDYTIHYLEAYYRERKALNGMDGYLERAYKSSGKAIMINAASVGAGFAVLAFSGFNILAQFGLLIAFTMATSSLSALIVLPVLLGWLKPKFLDKGNLQKT